MLIIDFDAYRQQRQIRALQSSMANVSFQPLEDGNPLQKFDIFSNGAIRHKHLFIVPSYEDSVLKFDDEPFLWKIVPHASHPNAVRISTDGKVFLKANGPMFDLVRESSVERGTVFLFIEPKKSIVS